MFYHVMYSVTLSGSSEKFKINVLSCAVTVSGSSEKCMCSH